MIQTALGNNREPPKPRQVRPASSRRPPSRRSQYADNVAMIIHILCRYPIWKLEGLDKSQWARLKLRDSPRPELRLFIRNLFCHFDMRADFAALALFYLLRFCEINPGPSPVYPKHILGAFILSNKFHDDQRISLKRWSMVTSIPVQELVEVELELLESLNWEVNISVAYYYRWGQFMHQLLQLERHLES